MGISRRAAPTHFAGDQQGSPAGARRAGVLGEESAGDPSGAGQDCVDGVLAGMVADVPFEGHTGGVRDAGWPGGDHDELSASRETRLAGEGQLHHVCRGLVGHVEPHRFDRSGSARRGCLSHAVIRRIPRRVRSSAELREHDTRDVPCLAPCRRGRAAHRERRARPRHAGRPEMCQSGRRRRSDRWWPARRLHSGPGSGTDLAERKKGH